MTEPAKHITMYDVGMRDGLQIQEKVLSTDVKLKLLDGLIAAGMREIQLTSFVHPKLVPQLADAEILIEKAPRPPDVHYWALIPNQKGAQRAASCPNLYGASLLISASDAHNLSNIRMRVDESLARMGDVVNIVRDAGMQTRGELATAFGCPFEGNVPAAQVLRIATRFMELGVDYLALCDTTGMADPLQVASLLDLLSKELPEMKISVHFHNTRGAGSANVLAAWQAGVMIFDTSFGGLGGCPFAPGATGNVATEDIVHMFDRMGVETGINLGKLIETARQTQEIFGFELPGQVMKAGPADQLHTLPG